MTADEFIGVVGIALDGVRKAREEGAERERRRIRRAQWEALDMLMIGRNALPGNDVATADTISRAVALLDAATRAPKKRGAR